MKKKIKNVTAHDLVFLIAVLFPFLLWFTLAFCSAISVGQNEQTIDMNSILTTLDFTKINILGLNNFNDWICSNIIQIDSTANDLTKYIVTFVLFQTEWTILVTFVRLFVNAICWLPNMINEKMKGE